MGVTYVPVEYDNNTMGILLYFDGHCCGWIKPQKFSASNWMEDAEQEIAKRFSSHTGGALVCDESETEYGKQYLAIDNTNLEFSYADTEWISETNIFHTEEEIDKLFISDEVFDDLLEQISFGENAFTKEAYEQCCSIKANGNFSESRSDFYKRFVEKNKENIAVYFDIGNKTYRLPEGTVAIKDEQQMWQVYRYSMIDGPKIIDSFSEEDMETAVVKWSGMSEYTVMKEDELDWFNNVFFGGKG